MANRPEVSPRDWISIGERGRVSGVVCDVRADDVEVVYLDDRSRAINEDVRWADTHWEFAMPGQGGGYADIYQRLSEYVAILRAGRK